VTKLLFPIAMLLGTAAALYRFSPPERRSRLRDRLSHVPTSMMERCMKDLPEESPPKAMMAGLGRMQEQNDEIIALLHAQEDLLRQRLPVDQVSPQEPPASPANESREGGERKGSGKRVSVQLRSGSQPQE
jgi:hypothetical protein